MEVEMLKSLLLGTAAGLVAVAGAQAADMPVKAAPVQYVKICSLYGDGFYYIPGTDTCLKMGGYLRVQAEYFAGGGGVVAGDSAGSMLGQARFDRVDTNDINYRVRGAISWDVRQQTEYGTLRTYIRFGAENTTPQVAGSGTTFNPFWDRAFIQFAGFTVGRSQSFFDLVTYGGAYSYHNVRVSGDTGASGQNLWAYTAQFGNGFSGTFSVEDPATRKGGTIDLATGGFPLIPATALVTDNAFTIAPGGVLNGFRVPDLIANLRVDQQWGFAGISAALHDVSGDYYGSNLAVNAVNANPGGGVTNGHPPDRYGWAVAGGAKFNLQGGDAAGFNVCYTEGAPGFCTNNNAFSIWNSNNSVGMGWIADGVFANGTQVELTRVWSALAFYEHIWNPKWRTSWFGGYVNVDYGSNATNLILQKTPGAFNACGVVAVAPVNLAPASTQLLPGNSCSPDYDFWEVGSRTQWNPVPQLDIGLEVLYSKRNTAFKGAAVVPASGSRPPVLVLDDQDVWSAMFRWQRNFYP
jgi:hypothetical protein